MNEYDKAFELMLMELKQSLLEGGVDGLLKKAEEKIANWYFMFWQEEYIDNEMMQGALEKSLHYQEWKLRDYRMVGKE